MRALPDLEQKLLALLIAKSPDASPYLTEILSSSEEVNWQRFGSLVERHRVRGLVRAGLAQFPAMGAPTQITEDLEKTAHGNAIGYFQAVQAVRELTGAFAKAGIKSVALKGVVVAEKYYSEPSQRQMIDVDILVEPGRYREAEEIARTRGFVRYVPKIALSDIQRESFMALHNAFGFHRKSDDVQLDLHWRMVHIPAMLPKLDADWTSMVVKSDIAGQSIPTLSAPVHFVYICVHGARAGWTRLKWLADVDRMLRGLTEGELTSAAEMFEANHLGRIGAASVLLSSHILGTPIPPAFARLTEQHDAQKLIELELQMIFTEAPASPPRLRDWRHFAGRIHHALILHRATGYRRQALLREIANPRDLEKISLRPQMLLALGMVSPVMSVGRAIARMFKRSSR